MKKSFLNENLLFINILFLRHVFNRYAFEIKNSCPAGQTIDHMSIWGFFAKNLSKTFNIFLSLKF